MRRRSIRTVGAVAALGAGLSAYGAYRRDIRAARARTESGSLLAQTRCGPIEYAIAGDGPPARIQFAIAYDSLRYRIVLSGGVNGYPQRIPSDLSEFDGTRPTQKHP